MNLAKRGLVIALVVVASSLALWIPAGMKKVYENFDGPYYVVVARSWYNKATIGKLFSFPLPLEYYPAHFPLYPALIELVNVKGRIGWMNAMLIVNLAATIVAGVVIYRIVEIEKWGNPWVFTLMWLFWWPRMWVVRSVGSPETLFILWVCLSLYLFQKKKYLWSGIMGALAVLTKSPGILLFISYGLWFLTNWVRNKKAELRIWPIMLIPLALIGLFYFYRIQTGDFWAYFNSGDNIHLQFLPFKVFNSDQPWVGNFWLEDVIWVYLLGGIGVVRAFKKNEVWGWFGIVFYVSILFVSHRDISRYALPLVPVAMLGMSEALKRKEVRWVLITLIIPLYFYSLNFLLHNSVAIADWTPFL